MENGKSFAVPFALHSVAAVERSRLNSPNGASDTQLAVSQPVTRTVREVRSIHIQ